MDLETKQLVYGKNDLERIVSVENTSKGKLRIYRELENGKVVYTEQPSVFWFLTNEYISSKQDELTGNQHYKYIGTFPTFKAREDVIKTLRQQEVDFYRIFDQKEQSLIYHGITYFKGMKPNEVSTLSFDIETNSLQHTATSLVLIITNTFRRNGIVTKQSFCLDDYNGDESRMIQDWINWVRYVDPSIVLGHNILGFDIPYLSFRCKELGIKFALGRDGSYIKFDMWESSKRVDGTLTIEYTNAHIFGREIVDTMFLSITYDALKKFPSYGLKPIIRYLGLEKEGRTFVDASKIGRYYAKIVKGEDCPEWHLSKQYAIEDSDDALTLFDTFINAYFYFTQSVSKSFQGMINSATGSQINNMMIRSYLQNGHSIPKADEVSSYEGAISFGIAGIYNNGFKLDVASLYPSIMRHFAVQHPTKDPQKVFVKLIEHFTVERLKNKKLAKETGIKDFKDLEASGKIFINSGYGFLGAAGLNYNYPDGAAFITAKGREVLAKATMFATSKPIEYWQGLSTNGDKEDV